MYVDYKILTKIDEKYRLEGSPFNGVAFDIKQGVVTAIHEIKHGVVAGDWVNPYFDHPPDIMMVDGTFGEEGIEECGPHTLYNGEPFIGLVFYFDQDGFLNGIIHCYGLSVEHTDAFHFSAPDGEIILVDFDEINPYGYDEYNHYRFSRKENNKLIRSGFRWDARKGYPCAATIPTCFGRVVFSYNSEDELRFFGIGKLTHEEFRVGYSIKPMGLDLPMSLERVSDVLSIPMLGKVIEKKIISLASQTRLSFDEYYEKYEELADKLDLSGCNTLYTSNPEVYWWFHDRGIKLSRLVFSEVKNPHLLDAALDAARKVGTQVEVEEK